MDCIGFVVKFGVQRSHWTDLYRFGGYQKDSGTNTGERLEFQRPEGGDMGNAVE